MQKNSIPVQENIPTPPMPTSKPNNLLLIGLGVLLLFSLGTTGFLLYQNSQLKKQIAQLQIRPTPTSHLFPSPTTPIISPTLDFTANWKTYINTKYGYSLKIPQNWGEWSAYTGDWQFGKDVSQSNLVLLGDYEGPPQKTSEGIIIPPQKIDVAVHLNRNKSDWIENLQKPEGECSAIVMIVGKQGIQTSKVICPGYHSITYLIEKEDNLYRITKGKEFSEFDLILSSFKFLE